MTNQPAACAARIACAFAASGISCCSNRIPGRGASASARSTSARVASHIGARYHHDRIGTARIDGDQRGAGRTIGRLRRHRCGRHRAAARQPGRDRTDRSPTQPAIATRAPSRAAATAWLAPLPPAAVKKSVPNIVCPVRGRCSQRATRSMFRLPITRTGSRTGIDLLAFSHHGGVSISLRAIWRHRPYYDINRCGNMRVGELSGETTSGMSESSGRNRCPVGLARAGRRVGSAAVAGVRRWRLARLARHRAGGQCRTLRATLAVSEEQTTRVLDTHVLLGGTGERPARRSHRRCGDRARTRAARSARRHDRRLQPGDRDRGDRRGRQRAGREARAFLRTIASTSATAGISSPCATATHRSRSAASWSAG